MNEIQRRAAVTEKTSLAPSIPIDLQRLSDVERVLVKEGYVCIFAFTISDPDVDSLVLVKARDRVDCHVHDKVVFFMQNEGGCRVWHLAIQDTIKPPPPHEDDEHVEVDDGDLQPQSGAAVVTSTVPAPNGTQPTFECEHDKGATREFDPNSTSQDGALDQGGDRPGNADAGTSTPQAKALSSFVETTYPSSLPPSLPPGAQKNSESPSRPASNGPPPLPSSHPPAADGRTVPSDPPTLSMAPADGATNGRWREVGLPEHPKGE